MRREVVRVLPESPEVDDLAQAGVLRRPGDVVRIAPLALLEACRAEGVDEVVDDLRPVQRAVDALAVLHVALHPSDAVAHFLVRRARDCCYLVFACKRWQKRFAHRSRRAEDDDLHGRTPPRSASK